MSEPFLAEIVMFAGNFAPRGWAFCQGQILSIAQNTALFSLLGTTYGGNGQTTFALPDLRGRVPVGTGQGLGLPTINLGEVSGAATATLLTTNLPAHTHGVNAASTAPSPALPSPSGNLLGPAARGAPPIFAPAGGGSVQMQAGMIAPTGGGQPFSIMQPYLGMNFIIAIEGIFPSRI